MAVIPASLRSWRSRASSAALSPLPAPGSTGAPTTIPPASLATSAAVTPPGSAATTRASPPDAGSSQSAATSPRSPSGLVAAAGSGRLEVNSSDPSGRKRGLPSPSADLVSRRAGPPCASILQMLVRYFFLSALRVCTAAASQVPSGASRSAVTRGSATKSPRS